MDIYRLDWDFRPTEIIDSFESVVWTERYSGNGDFSMTVKSNYLLTEDLDFGIFIGSSISQRVMMVETADIQAQSDGYDLVTLSGRSIEAFLENRDNTMGNKKEPEVVSGSPAAIAEYMVRKYCVDASTAGSVNVIPNLRVSGYPEPGPYVRMALDRGDIYGIVKKICEAYDLGFAIRREDNDLVFYLYKGIDRTSPSTSYYMEYSADNGNLLTTSSLESVANYKNHARVVGNKVGTDVYAPGTPSSVSGLQRRTIVLEYNVGTAADYVAKPGKPATTAADDRELLAALGKQELAKINNRYIKMIDGEIPQNSWNDIYYGLGDIVMVKDKYGKRTKCRITEQIFSADKNGEKQLPTFTAI